MPIPGKKCLPLPASPYAVDHLHRHKIHSSTSPLSRGVPKTRNIPPAAAHKPACSYKSVRCPWLRAWNAFNEGSSSSKTTQCETLRLNPLSAVTLPFAAAFYMYATVHSAVNYWLGRGGTWKGRV